MFALVLFGFAPGVRKTNAKWCSALFSGNGPASAFPSYHSAGVKGVKGTWPQMLGSQMALVRTQIIPLELSKSFSMACQASVDRQSYGPVIHTVSNRLCVFGLGQRWQRILLYYIGLSCVIIVPSFVGTGVESLTLLRPIAFKRSPPFFRKRGNAVTKLWFGEMEILAISMSKPRGVQNFGAHRGRMAANCGWAKTGRLGLGNLWWKDDRLRSTDSPCMFVNVCHS